MGVLELLMVACLAGSIWLSCKSYADENEKRVGWRIAMFLFFVVLPLLGYHSK